MTDVLHACAFEDNYIWLIRGKSPDRVAIVDPGDAGLRLDVKHDIATRTGLQCAPLVHQRIGTLREQGTVRFSIGAFNTEEHVDAAIAAMAEVAAWAAGR